jgi:hypothetical protein
MSFSATLSRWEFMWLLALGIYLACKNLSWTARTTTAPRWKHVAYLMAWPGMDCSAFLKSDTPRIQPPTAAEWLFGAAKLAIGTGLLWGAVPALEPMGSIVQGWAGMIGLVFILHFGLFHVLSCAWRSMGVTATPLMNWPITSVSVAEFWGRRWNLAFRDLTHRFLFAPLRRPLGPAGALVAGFLVSGLVHDVVISWPSEAGWGLPTIYFALQGIAILAERSPAGRTLGLGRGLAGRAFCLAIVGLPSPLVFHAAFLRNVIGPFLAAVGAAS